MCTIDGTQYHSSTSVHCDGCLTKEHKSGELTYSHGVLQGAIMHPDKKQVIPVMPEAIKNKDGTKKQDCELNLTRHIWTLPRSQRISVRFCAAKQYKSPSFFLLYPSCLNLYQGLKLA